MTLMVRQLAPDDRGFADIFTPLPPPPQMYIHRADIFDHIFAGGRVWLAYSSSDADRQRYSRAVRTLRLMTPDRMSMGSGKS